MIDYPNVKHAHIVPRVYLANFAVDEKIGTRLVHDGGQRLLLPIEKVGTRRRYYSRKRPDGSWIDDIEWSLSKGENACAPIIRSFEDRWPFSFEDKAKVAELFAYQLLRGPRWEEEHAGFVERAIEDFGKLETLEAAEKERASEAFRSDTHRFIQMLRIGPTAASVLASMHWTLVRFDSPVVATSDHPVVPWPGADSLAPQPTPILPTGLCECIEIRLPMSPSRAVLMTWADTPDDLETTTRGARHHAANLNAFTVASADRQWFHLPGTSPPVGSGKFRPLSTELVKGYTPLAAAKSYRRERTLAEAKKLVGRELQDRDLRIVTMSQSGLSVKQPTSPTE